tara:strand:- start:642 stop:956 length:315 start_codon:yes stop_codon:yes gene_type:complete
MFGPEAYEKYFQTKIKKEKLVSFSKRYLIIEYKGDDYYYSLENCAGLFQTSQEFEKWCTEDVKNRDGFYSDAKFVIWFSNNEKEYDNLLADLPKTVAHKRLRVI